MTFRPKVSIFLLILSDSMLRTSNVYQRDPNRTYYIVYYPSVSSRFNLITCAVSALTPLSTAGSISINCYSNGHSFRTIVHSV